MFESANCMDLYESKPGPFVQLGITQCEHLVENPTHIQKWIQAGKRLGWSGFEQPGPGLSWVRGYSITLFQCNYLSPFPQQIHRSASVGGSAWYRALMKHLARSIFIMSYLCNILIDRRVLKFMEINPSSQFVTVIKQPCGGWMTSHRFSALYLGRLFTSDPWIIWRCSPTVHHIYWAHQRFIVYSWTITSLDGVWCRQHRRHRYRWMRVIRLDKTLTGLLILASLGFWGEGGGGGTHILKGRGCSSYR